MSQARPDVETELNRRFEEAQKVVATPDTGEPGSAEWRMCVIKKQAAIKTMLLDRRISELDRNRLESTYEHQRLMLDEYDRQQQRNWEMEQRKAELELQTQYRDLTLRYSEASRQTAESQTKQAEQSAKNAEVQARSVIRATWVLAFATIVLAIATIVLIFVTAGGH